MSRPYYRPGHLAGRFKEYPAPFGDRIVPYTLSHEHPSGVLSIQRALVLALYLANAGELDESRKACRIVTEIASRYGYDVRKFLFWEATRAFVEGGQEGEDSQMTGLHAGADSKQVRTSTPFLSSLPFSTAQSCRSSAARWNNGATRSARIVHLSTNAPGAPAPPPSTSSGAPPSTSSPHSPTLPPPRPPPNYPPSKPSSPSSPSHTASPASPSDVRRPFGTLLNYPLSTNDSTTHSHWPNQP